MRIFFFVCFSYCRMCSLLAYHIIYTWLRLFIAVYVYFRIAYIICEPHWIDRQHDHEQLQVWAYAIFGWLFDFDHSFHHLALEFVFGSLCCVRFNAFFLFFSCPFHLRCILCCFLCEFCFMMIIRWLYFGCCALFFIFYYFFVWIVCIWKCECTFI